MDEVAAGGAHRKVHNLVYMLYVLHAGNRSFCARSNVGTAGVNGVENDSLPGQHAAMQITVGSCRVGLDH